MMTKCGDKIISDCDMPFKRTESLKKKKNVRKRIYGILFNPAPKVVVAKFPLTFLEIKGKPKCDV